MARRQYVLDDDGVGPPDGFPGIDLVPSDEDREAFAEALGISRHELVERERFLDAVASGTEPELAGIEVGWTLYRTRQIMKDTEFAELISLAQNALDMRISRVVANQALHGHEWAVKLWLFNKRPDLFKDVRHIEVKHGAQIAPHVLAATREAVREGVRDAIKAGNIASLQPAPDYEIEDAEVISDVVT